MNDEQNQKQPAAREVHRLDPHDLVTGQTAALEVRFVPVDSEIPRRVPSLGRLSTRLKGS